MRVVAVVVRRPQSEAETSRGPRGSSGGRLRAVLRAGVLLAFTWRDYLGPNDSRRPGASRLRQGAHGRPQTPLDQRRPRDGRQKPPRWAGWAGMLRKMTPSSQRTSTLHY